MTASKTLTTAVAAATIVGAISFAYAQTTDSSSTPPTQGAPAAEQSQNPTAGPSSTSPSTLDFPVDFDLAFDEHALEQHATVERLGRGTELDRHQLDAVERARTEGRPQLIAVQSEYREIRRSDR